MSRIYLVRHGLTEANAAGIVQDLADPLTEKGKEQAERLASRLAKISFATLVASDMHRARMTAEAVAAQTGHTVESSRLFREFQYPSSLIGLTFGDPKVEAYKAAHLEHADDLDWKWEDEESLRELRARAKAALEFAMAQPMDTVVVSHGRFIRHMILMHLFEGGITGSQEQKANLKFLSSNTGVTVLEKDKHGNFRLLMWNDHAHLG